MKWMLLLDMVQGKYLHLGQRPATEYDWWTLWMLAYEVNKVNPNIAQAGESEPCTGIDGAPLT
ncbi:hypothetical protein LCGC14_2944370 [marine sediment metagenome]|uniref:Uncharacterized protein n=1 Tax=marine sediment metagenome TaxID=412755 RepID=A0A0F8XH05_9ZZZZ